MLASERLEALMPLALGGDIRLLHEMSGPELDIMDGLIDQALLEINPLTCVATMPMWEQTYGLVPERDEPLESRRASLIRKIRARGGLSREYFVMVAETLGYEIEITEYMAWMIGWSAVGDWLLSHEFSFVWTVTVRDIPRYEWEIGWSSVSDPLIWMPLADRLTAMLDELKPAHTLVTIEYA